MVVIYDSCGGAFFGVCHWVRFKNVGAGFCDVNFIGLLRCFGEYLR